MAECVKENFSYSIHTITKEPVTEKKTIEVPVTHEELIVEKRPPKESSSPSAERSFSSSFRFSRQ
jgi:uncharacterized protein (TIGR02271 family)